MRQILCVLGLAILFTACQKELSFDTPVDPGTGPGNPTNPATSYSPLTPGTWWVYQDSTSLDTVKQTVIATTKTNNGVTYKGVIADDPMMDTTFYGVSGTKYYQWAEGNTQSGGFASIVLQYLDAGQAVGASGTYPAGSGNGMTATGTNTTIAKNISMTVLGKNYTEVIHSRLGLSYAVGGMNIDLGSYDFFTAKGVGIIKVRSEVSFMGQVIMTVVQELKNHQVM